MYIQLNAIMSLAMTSLKANKQAKRSKVVNLRVEANKRNLIDTAASLSGKTRTEFILDAAYKAAEEALLDRRLFILSDEEWEAFNNALDAPPKENEKLAKLLKAKTPWS